MSTTLVFLKQFGGHDGMRNWSYQVGKTVDVLTRKRTKSLNDDFYTFLDFIQSTYGADGNKITILTNNMNPVSHKFIDPEFIALYPDISYFTPPTPYSRQLLEGLLRGSATLPTHKPHKNTLFISSDASADRDNTVSAWAWVAPDSEQKFNFGRCFKSNFSTSELEGLLHAIVDNKDTGYQKMHLYCDSFDSVERVLDVVVKGEDTVLLKWPYLNELIVEARKVAETKTITANWVRGHKSHRLNQAADAFAAHARNGYSTGINEHTLAVEAEVLKDFLLASNIA